MHSMWIPNERKKAEASSHSFFIFEDDEAWEGKEERQWHQKLKVRNGILLLNWAWGK